MNQNTTPAPIPRLAEPAGEGACPMGALATPFTVASAAVSISRDGGTSGGDAAADRRVPATLSLALPDDLGGLAISREWGGPEE